MERWEADMDQMLEQNRVAAIEQREILRDQGNTEGVQEMDRQIGKIDDTLGTPDRRADAQLELNREATIEEREILRDQGDADGVKEMDRQIGEIDRLLDPDADLGNPLDAPAAEETQEQEDPRIEAIRLQLTNERDLLLERADHEGAARVQSMLDSLGR